MRQSLLVSALIMVSLFVGISFARAENYGLDTAQKASGGLIPKTVAGAQTVPQLIGKLVAALLTLLGIIFFLLIFYAGLSWMLARGNADGVTKAKDIMEAAIIGLIVVTGSYAISRFVFDKLGATSSTASVGTATKLTNEACHAFDNSKDDCTKAGCAYSDGVMSCYLGQ